MIPYSGPAVSSILRGMPTDQLAAARPRDFQRWPAAVVLPANVLSELIANEKARRRK